MKTRFLLPLLVLLLVPYAFADFDLAKWQYMKEIPVDSTRPDRPVRVFLDREVDAVSPTLSDLRVTDATGTEIPYEILRSDDVEQPAPDRPAILDHVSRPVSVTATISANGPGDGKIVTAKGTETMLILDFGQRGTLHDRLSLDIDGSNYRRSVRVYASDSLLSHASQEWQLLPENGYVYDYTDSKASWSHRENTVSIPPTSTRYLRLVLEGDGQLKVRGVTAEASGHAVTSDDVHNDFPPVVTEDSVQRATVVTIDTGSDHFRSRGITLSSPDVNFARRVSVESSDDGRNWSRVIEGGISNIETPLFRGRSEKIMYPEIQARYVRALVYHHDDQPIAFSNPVSLLSEAHVFFFEAKRGQSSYRLFYGNPGAQQPTYDLSSRSHFLELASSGATTMSPQQPNPHYVAPTPAPIPWHERYPGALNAILIVCVLAVGGLVFAYLKKAKAS